MPWKKVHHPKARVLDLQRFFVEVLLRVPGIFIATLDLIMFCIFIFFYLKLFID